MSTLISGARKLDAEGEAEDFWLLFDGDTIAATGQGTPPPATERVDAAGLWLVPGFIDLHGHGGGGHGFDNGPDEIRAALAAHRIRGTTRSLISLVANPLPAVETSLRTITEIAAADPLVLGAHLEGPFLTPSRRGAHNPHFLLSPSVEVARELIAAGDGSIRQTTVAPELPGALDVIDLFVEAGITVAIGHTEATAAEARAAFDHGARMLTHAFNAMPGIHHRSPGPVVAAFEDDRVIIELILDGLHVHPDVASLAFLSAAGRVALVTDAMAAAGAEDGHYRLGSLNVTVRDGLAVLSGTDTMAGSTLTQDAALRTAVNRVGVDPRAAVEALTRTPARAIGVDDRFGILAPGYAADAVLLDASWQVQQVWANGVLLSSA
ncbi:N-acetylglucosamine-6-phosphate deacetylase [Salinibacterium sp. ZJ454]|uniref:N-acetylglucosamine-6-phosphate deacetylase n=1 Tax=Salinibacterium sp. ZJ454 TaxID=2708339 RepID=UPI00142071A8|nr:N-acetylglucosamine-6-phosphate deacetylase [Salinibacterium sp. ZJ454]